MHRNDQDRLPATAVKPLHRASGRSLTVASGCGQGDDTTVFALPVRLSPVAGFVFGRSFAGWTDGRGRRQSSGTAAAAFLGKLIGSAWLAALRGRALAQGSRRALAQVGRGGHWHLR